MGVAVAFATRPPMTLPERIVAGWDVGALVVCALAWLIFLRSTSDDVARRAAEEDPGRTFVQLVTLFSCAAGILAATMLYIEGTRGPRSHAAFASALCVATVAISWTLTHTSFALRYAHLYYRDGGGDAKTPRLHFPDQRAPDDVDFAYFAFTIGMTFQVSDVDIADRTIRRAVLAHSILSFAYNTAILAFAINLVSSHLKA
jgi:uncharacterized membrane protein